jgi:hypothetical protein
VFSLAKNTNPPKGRFAALLFYYYSIASASLPARAGSLTARCATRMSAALSLCAATAATTSPPPTSLMYESPIAIAIIRRQLLQLNNKGRNQSMKQTFSVIALALVLSACGEPAKSVEYFVAHPGEIADTLKNCAENAGAANCESARKAQAQIDGEKQMAQYRDGMRKSCMSNLQRNKVADAEGICARKWP